MNQSNALILKQELISKPICKKEVSVQSNDEKLDQKPDKKQELILIDVLDHCNVEELQRLEDKKDTDELLKKSLQVTQIMQDLNELLDEQDEQLNGVDTLTDEAVDAMDVAIIDIGKAKKSFFQSRLIKGSFIGAIVGLFVGGPAGGAIGYSVGAGVVGAGIVGSLTGIGLGFGSTYAGLQGKVKE